jgi:4-hydroxy-tetrahydrodipicolinate synthase
MITGSLVALVTPMDQMGEVDFDSLTRLIEFHIQAGTDGLVVCGTTGESGMLSAKEHQQIIRHTVKQVDGRIPVIAGTGAVGTHHTIDHTKAAKDLGVQACLLLAPPYVKPTQEGLYRHYRTVAETVDIPQILYNVPGRTACDILPETIARLAEVPNIVGIKEASGILDRIKRIKELCGDRLVIYSGEDALTLEIMRQGGKGVISVTANVVPRAMHSLCEAALAGDWYLARAINTALVNLHKMLFVESNPIPVKWLLAEMGLIPSGIRLPLTPLSLQHYGALQEALHQATEALAKGEGTIAIQ